MREPPSREQGGSDERLSARRPADMPEQSGATLVEHLVDKLARAERELGSAREAAAEDARHRALLRGAARQVAAADVLAADVVRPALAVLGQWCLLDQVANGQGERLLITANPDLDPLASLLQGTVRLDGEGSLGIVRALRRRRTERLDHVTLESPSGRLDDAPQAPALDALERLAVGPVIVSPITARGRIVGALTFGRAHDDRLYTDQEQRLAEELAQIIGLAFEHQRVTAVAEAAARTKSEFLAMMSHELRTPLNAIAGYAQLLEMGFRGPLSEGQRDAVSRILRGQEHLLTLVDAVLTFSRLTSGRLAIDSTELDASDLIDLASEPLVVEFAAREIDFRILPCPEKSRVCADRERAVEILRHLLSNALKFTRRGGAVTVGCDPGPGLIEFVVSDTGLGIPDGQRESIFQPFVQVEKGLTRSADGSGLGLSIGRELAERMGGSLTVTSEVGTGSRFVLSLVRAVDDPVPSAIDSTPGAG
ncbi:MAG: GAF domain-containing sensor histidine kinase [bacterium]